MPLPTDISDRAMGIAAVTLLLSLSGPSEAFSTQVRDSHLRGESKRS